MHSCAVRHVFATMDVLLEFRGSKLPLKVTPKTVQSAVEDAAKVKVARVAESGAVDTDVEDTGDNYILQRFSSKWSSFVDVCNFEEVKDGDRLTLTLKVHRL